MSQVAEDAVVILLHTIGQLKSRGFHANELGVLKDLVVRQHPLIMDIALNFLGDKDQETYLEKLLALSGKLAANEPAGGWDAPAPAPVPESSVDIPPSLRGLLHKFGVPPGEEELFLQWAKGRIDDDDEEGEEEGGEGGREAMSSTELLEMQRGHLMERMAKVKGQIAELREAKSEFQAAVDEEGEESEEDSDDGWNEESNWKGKEANENIFIDPSDVSDLGSEGVAAGVGNDMSLAEEMIRIEGIFSSMVEGGPVVTEAEGGLPLQYLKAVVNKVPMLAVAHACLARGHMDEGRFESALKYFNNAVTVCPDFTAAHAELGMLFQELKQPERACLALGKAVSIEPENPMLHCSLGSALMDVEMPDKAEKAFLHAMQV
jgi:tetratricopeptide (TPR) repeat protein